MTQQQTIRPSSLGLRSVALLQGLPAERLDRLAEACAWRTFTADQRIVARNATDRDVYLVISGSVRVTSYSAEGRQVTFRDIAAGECFGEVAAIDGSPRSADVIALESSLVASMPQQVFAKLLHEHSTVAERLIHHLARLVRQSSERVIALSTLGVHHRIQSELLRLARATGVHDNCARIDPAPRHADIASQVSTYREQVTRELSALARAGIVRRDRGALVVLDIQRLADLVGEA